MTSRACLIIVATLALAACSAKPPECPRNTKQTTSLEALFKGLRFPAAKRICLDAKGKEAKVFISVDYQNKAGKKPLTKAVKASEMDGWASTRDTIVVLDDLLPEAGGYRLATKQDTRLDLVGKEHTPHRLWLRGRTLIELKTRLHDKDWVAITIRDTSEQLYPEGMSKILAKAQAKAKRLVAELQKSSLPTSCEAAPKAVYRVEKKGWLLSAAKAAEAKSPAVQFSRLGMAKSLIASKAFAVHEVLERREPTYRENYRSVKNFKSGLVKGQTTLIFGGNAICRFSWRGSNSVIFSTKSTSTKHALAADLAKNVAAARQKAFAASGAKGRLSTTAK